MENNNVNIAWLFPDTLYLHGERGNVIALKKMCELAGMTVNIHKIDFDTADFNPMDFDFIFCPPGEIASFSDVIEYLKPKSDLLRAYIDFGNPMLVTGTSVAMWGNKIKRIDGSEILGLGIADFSVSENEAIYGDDLFYKATLPGCSHPIFGSQIQMMDILADQNAERFGNLYYGYGNHGGNDCEGIRIDYAVFTNTLGPILVLNPWLTQVFVEKIAKKIDYKIPEDFNPSMELEEASYQSKVQFTMNKDTNLSNCIPLKQQNI